MLGSNLMVANLTNYDQIIELSVDSNSYKYNVQDVISRYPETIKPQKGEQSLPFQINKLEKQYIVNSEIKHESWYIENPVSKELTKRITLKLGPKTQQDFVVVLRAPSPKRSENMLAFLNVGLLTYKSERFGVDESFEDFLAR